MDDIIQHIKKWQSGDDACYDIIFKHYYNVSCRTAFQLTRDRQAAEDIVQEFFISFWKKRERLAITTNPDAYFKRAIINRSINYIKSRKAQQGTDTIKDIPSLSNTATNLHRTDDQKVIKHCIEKLTPRRRQIFTLYRLEDLKYKEIAELLSISVKTVEVQLRLARESLRACLKLNLKGSYVFK